MILIIFSQISFISSDKDTEKQNYSKTIKLNPDTIDDVANHYGRDKWPVRPAAEELKNS